jgi:glycosyltransferase involved in cell wall biosynthesis
MNIALVHANLPGPGRRPGGVEIAVHRLANALTDLGKDEVTVLAATTAPPDARYRRETISEAAPLLVRNQLARLILLPAALNFAGLARFDVVHLHGDDWFLFSRRTATVRSLHGSALREAQHAVSLRHKLLMYGVYGLEHLSARLCTLPLAVGRDTAAVYGVNRIVANGVDSAVFFPGPKSPTPRVLFVGTWEGRKRGKLVYDVFLRDVLPRVPNAELCMVCDYCPPHPRVIAEVFPTDTTLAERFREAWVFTLPSTYEGFGIPYLEALASGTAVVATSNGGAREVLDEGRFGEIVDDASLGGTIARLLEDGDRRWKLESRGLERAKDYAWTAIACHHRNLYLEAMASYARMPTSRARKAATRGRA